MAEYRLGKRPARKGAISFKLTDYLDMSAFPKPPVRIGHESIGQPWGMFANDKYSDCVFAGAAHEHMVWKHEAGGRVSFNDAGVLADYSAVTGFKPHDPDSDQGTDMGEAAAYRRKTGIIDSVGVRHRIDSYLGLREGEPDHLAIAAYLFGAVGIGLQLPNSAMDQLDAKKPWEPVAKTGGMAGGHYVPCIGRNSKGDFLVVTWGAIQAMSPAFYARFNDESVAYLNLDILKDGKSPEGFDEAALRRNLNALGKPK